MYYYDCDDWLFYSFKYIVGKPSLEQDNTFIKEMEYILGEIK